MSSIAGRTGGCACGTPLCGLRRSHRGSSLVPRRLRSCISQSVVFAANRRKSSTGGGNRTHTGLPPEDFKSSASAIPPRRQDSAFERRPSITSQRGATRRDLGVEAAAEQGDRTLCRVSWHLDETEGVGFEPTVGFHLLRFSRPSQSTTLAPLLLNRTFKTSARDSCQTRCLASTNSSPSLS